jgi:hypothetical protein
MSTKGKCNTVNNEYNVTKSKCHHLSYPQLLSYINFYYEYKTHTKASLNANTYYIYTSDRYK